MKEILTVDGLSKRFKNIHAVNNISFSVQQGDIFAFLGPNGAGKTTMLRILLDIIKADKGKIDWNINGNSSQLPDPSQIGYLPEERGLYTDVPIIRSLIYMASIRGMEKQEAKEAAMEWLGKVQLADRAKEKLQALSKGNQQKIQFISSILHKPSFAVLDEPFAGLDPVTQENFIEFIHELNKQGTTILLCSHQMQLVERIAGKVFLINEGKEVYNGSLNDIYNIFGEQLIIDIGFSGEIPGDKLNSLTGTVKIEKQNNRNIQIAFEANVKISDIMNKLSSISGISHIRSHNPTLHDVFLALVKKEQNNIG